MLSSEWEAIWDENCAIVWATLAFLLLWMTAVLQKTQDNLQNLGAMSSVTCATIAFVLNMTCLKISYLNSQVSTGFYWLWLPVHIYLLFVPNCNSIMF